MTFFEVVNPLMLPRDCSVLFVLWFVVDDVAVVSDSAPAYSVQLTLNSRTGMLTVYENQSTTVVLECIASGIPLPDLLLVNTFLKW